MTQSRVRVGSMAASTTLAVWLLSRTVTVRSSSSVSTSTSFARRSKRFMLTVPEDSTTWSGSMRVTRPIGTKMRCRWMQLDDQAQHARRLAVGPQHRHRVADLAELVAAGVEDVDAGQPGDEDAVAAAHAGLRWVTSAD